MPSTQDLTDADLGARISQIRRAAGLSQALLARAVGLDRTAITKIESGRRAVTAIELTRLARALRRPIESLLSKPLPLGPDALRELRRKRKQILSVAAKHGARNVRVFGSVVRGEAGPESDVDFLVDLDSDRSLLDHAGLWMDLEALIGRRVDVATSDGLKARLRERVLREAMPL